MALPLAEGDQISMGNYLDDLDPPERPMRMPTMSELILQAEIARAKRIRRLQQLGLIALIVLIASGIKYLVW